jgi:hypothetical protein
MAGGCARWSLGRVIPADGQLQQRARALEVELLFDAGAISVGRLASCDLFGVPLSFASLATFA